MTRGILFLLAWLGIAAPAVADDIVAYHVDGAAQLAVADTRTAALDDAFARAVQSALIDVVPEAARATRQSDLDRELVGRSRLWVTGFTVTKDRVTGTRRELMVTVQVDRDKIRTQLERLNISILPRIESPKLPTMAIVVRVPQSLRGREGAAGAEALTNLFRAEGMAVDAASGRGRVGSFIVDAERSSKDGESGGAISEVDWTTTADVFVGEASFIRGQARQVVLVTARLRVVAAAQATGTVSAGDRRAESAASVAAFADDVQDGVVRALQGAASDMLPRLRVALRGPRPLEPPVRSGGGSAADDTPFVAPGIVLVRVVAGSPFSVVAAQQKRLLGAKGIQAAALRRISRAGWILGVSTNESIDRVAQIAASSSDTPVSVRVVRGVVEVTALGPIP